MKSDFADFRILKRRVPVELVIEEIKERWCIMCYLVLNMRIDELVKYRQWQIPTELYTEVAEHLYAYVYEDTMPPAEIASTILNVADDFVRGEPVRFRAGDYIALENYRRSHR